MMSEKLMSEKPVFEKQAAEIQEYRKITFDSALTFAAVLEGLAVAVAAWLFALQLEPNQRAALVGAAALVGGASAALGAFTGFLFGIPKALQRLDGANQDREIPARAGAQVSASRHPQSSARSERGLRFVSNSNLEQISDWLTKILVGVGLIQIGTLPDALSRLGAYLKPSFGNLDSSPAFAIGLVISVFFIAFMLEYMWTRTRFLQLLDDYADDHRNNAIGKEGEDARGDRPRVASDEGQ